MRHFHGGPVMFAKVYARYRENTYRVSTTYLVEGNSFLLSGCTSAIHNVFRERVSVELTG